MQPLDVRDFGAEGDGESDDSAAFQRALEAAAESRGTVFVPDGVFRCADVKVPPQTGLVGNPTWRYTEPGGSILRLSNEKAACLLNLTGAIGCTINGLCLDGGKLGEGVHGILVDKPDYITEDAFRIERCWVARFTGDGVHLGRIWCFSIRHSMVAFNRGNGLWLKGWDGFVLDNWFSGNRQAGFGAFEENASITMVGNRIEWNQLGGIVLHAGGHYNISSNYIDRSGGPGIDLHDRCRQMTIVGNVIYRSGKPWRELSKHDSSHARLEGGEGIVFSGNMMTMGRDDGGKGDWSPRCAMVYGGLTNSVIASNVMHNAALEELMIDLGGHGEGVVVRDNVGSLGSPR